MKLLALGVFFMAWGYGCGSIPQIIVLEDPLTPEEHLNLGIAYEKKGEFDPAIKEYEAAAKKLNIANLYIGNAYLEKKDFNKAETYYTRAIETDNDPRLGDAYNNLAWLYYLKNEQLDKAEALVMKAIEVNPAGAGNYKDTLAQIRKLKNK